MGDEPADMLTWEQIQAQTMAQYGPASQPQRQHSTQQGRPTGSLVVFLGSSWSRLCFNRGHWLHPDER